jgi:DNA-binding PadR family transcriptional regulator
VAVREALLCLLSDGPSYGYQLKAGFEAATGGVWPLNVGQVYTTLERLERDGLVVSANSNGEGTQRSYQLTDAGYSELGGWWEAVPGEEPPPRDELTVKILLAVGTGREHAIEVISNQRDALLSLLQERRRRLPVRTKPEAELGAQLMADALFMRAEADIRWLDVCEERVLDLPGEEPAPAKRTTTRRRRGRRGGSA